MEIAAGWLNPIQRRTAEAMIASKRILGQSKNGPPMIALRLLVVLQAVFAAASLTYLAASGIREAVFVEPLSAAPLVFSIAAFVVYAGCLFLPRVGLIGGYRGAMVVAVVLFGGGGVIGNVVRYLGSGLENYASTAAWAVAVAINAFGSVLNIIAAPRWCHQPSNIVEGGHR